MMMSADVSRAASEYQGRSWSESDSADSADSDGSESQPPAGLVISQSREQVGPAFGNIAVTSCADVHFGNKTYYKGPVTIKQFLYGSSPPNDVAGALENRAFEYDDKYAHNGVEIRANGKSDVSCGPAVEIEHTPPQSNHKGVKLARELWNKWRVKKREILIVTGGILICTLIVILLSTVYLVPADRNTMIVDASNEDDNKNIPIKTDIGNVLLPGRTLRLISRQEWVAQPPVMPADKLKTPVDFVIITHTATENCTDQASCTFHVRYIQTFHIESRNWWDIGYNFLVGGDGCAYEGRGWDSEGAHTKGYNVVSIGIAFIGTFNNMKAPDRQLNAAKSLIEQGVKLGKISPQYKLFGHRQLIPSLSPGDELYIQIKTWPHWSNNTDQIEHV